MRRPNWLRFIRRWISRVTRVGKTIRPRFRPSLLSFEDRTVPVSAPWAVSMGGNGTQVLFSPTGTGVPLDLVAYEADFVLGSHVAVGDVTGDGVADLVTGPGVGGGPRVIVFDGTTGQVNRTFFAYESEFRGGTEVAVGDVNGDGVADIITAPSRGGGSHVRAFSRASGEPLLNFMAGSVDERGGAFVAAGDFNGDGHADVVVGSGVGALPRLQVFSSLDGTVLHAEAVYEPSFSGGVQIAVGTQSDGAAQSVWTAAEVGGDPRMRRYDAASWEVVEDRFVFDPNLRVGMAIAAGVIPLPADRLDAVDDVVTTPYETATVIPVLANDTAADRSPLRLLAVSSPEHGTAVMVGSDVVYTPTNGFSGTDRFLYTVTTPGGLSDTAQIIVTVEPRATVPPSNAPPVASDDEAVTDYETAVPVDVLKNDTDANGDPLRVIAVGNPGNGSVSFDGSVVTYSPNAGFAGSDSFAYTVGDGRGGTAVGIVRISVRQPIVVPPPPPENSLPVALNDRTETAHATAVNIDVMSNDSDPDGDRLTIVSITTPIGGMSGIVGSNVLYTPRLGFSGPDSFAYTIADGRGGTATATVTITVAIGDPLPPPPPGNRSPVAFDDFAETNFETPVLIPALANDTDPDGDDVTIVSAGTPAKGVVEVIGTTIRYSPNRDTSGRIRSLTR